MCVCVKGLLKALLLKLLCGFLQDAPFMLNLRQFCRVGLIEDLAGYCMHVVHADSTCVGPEVSFYLSEEQLEALSVASKVPRPCFFCC